MARRKAAAKASAEVATQRPKSLAFLDNGGVTTSENYRNAMSALMGDLLAGRISPIVGNAVCKVGNSMVRVVELEYKFAGLSGEHRALLPMARDKR